MKIASLAISEIMKELSLQAEAEIERELKLICEKALEANKDRIIDEVRQKYLISVNACLAQGMNDAGMSLHFSFVPKNSR